MRGGILIIGSLLWDDAAEREAWRKARLLLDLRQNVVAPLQYGRRSQSRGNTFTMTVAPGEPAGTAAVVPCAASVYRIEDLVNEAEALWKAEQPSARAAAMSAAWGCVGVVFRPDNRALDWTDHWRDVFSKHASPTSPVDEHGILQIGWPPLSDRSDVTLDFLLATVTRRACTRPTPEAIADAWINQNAGHERYFFENVRNDIRTADDLAIWKRMSQMNPRWLQKADYAEAQAMLTSEVHGAA